LFNKASGVPLGSLQGGGGCFVLLTEDNRLLHGPGNKTGWIQESSERDRSKIATFNDGTALVVQGNTAYLLTDAALIAIDRRTHKELWRRAAGTLHALILAGDVLLAERIMSKLSGRWMVDHSGMRPWPAGPLDWPWLIRLCSSARMKVPSTVSVQDKSGPHL
jgi:hypothetical protein